MFLKSRNCLDKLNKYIKGTLNNDLASKYDRSSTVVPYSTVINYYGLRSYCEI